MGELDVSEFRGGRLPCRELAVVAGEEGEGGGVVGVHMSEDAGFDGVGLGVCRI